MPIPGRRTVPNAQSYSQFKGLGVGGKRLETCVPDNEQKKREDAMPSLTFPHRRCWFFVVAVAFLAAITPVPVYAQMARIELDTFQSTTLTDQEFLTGKREGKPVIIPGELRIPRPGTDRLPAVVLVHGSGGISGFVDEWAQWLNAMGVGDLHI
jgi:hypothetical protein